MEENIDLFIISDIEHSSPRITNLIYYLPSNYNKIWISADPDGKINENDLPLGFYKKVKLLYFKRGLNLFSKGKIIENGIIKNKSSLISLFYFKIKRLLIKFILNILIPDQYFFTYRKYIILFNKYYNPKNKTIILSSFPYATPNIASYFIKKSNENVQWLIDYRDLWTFNHNYSFSKIRKRIDFLIEKKILSNVDKVLCVTKENQKIISNKFKIKSNLILNGFSYQINYNFDSKDFFKKNFKGSKTRILHVGTLSPEFQDLDLLLSSENLSESNIEIHFMGRFSSILNEEVEKRDLGHKIKYIGMYTRDESIQIQKLYDGLVYFESKFNTGVLLLKFYEYINADKPIISIGGLKKTESKEILKKLDRGLLIEDKISMAKFLKNPKSHLNKIKFDIENKFLFSYENRAKELNDVIDSHIKKI